MITKENVDNEFIYYLLSILKNKFLQNASGSTFLEISPNKVKEVEINIPTYQEQKAIAQILSDMDKEIETLKTKLKKTKNIKIGMMQELLTGKTRLK
jgi:type I restriction enzyme S subunit